MRFRIYIVSILLFMISCESKKEIMQIKELKKIPYSMKGYNLYSWIENEKEFYRLSTALNIELKANQIITKNSEIEEDYISVLLSTKSELVHILKIIPANSFILIQDDNWTRQVDSIKYNHLSVKQVKTMNKSITILNN